MLKRLLYACALIISVFTSSAVWAQETTADIQGTVTDGKTGVSGVIITAIHQPSGTKYVTSTRKDGRYNLPNLRVGGPYVITTSYVGYKEEKQEGIFLALGEEFKGDFSLTVTATQLGDVIVKTVRQDKTFNNAHTGS